MDKRKEPPTLDISLFKRQRPDEASPWERAIAHKMAFKNREGAALQTPTRILQGQTAEVYTCQFSPSGHHISSAGAEKSIYLWNTFGGSDNCGIIRGHIGAIHELRWSRDASMVFTASADRTCGVFDAQTGQRIKNCKGHTSAVSSCSLARNGPELMASGSDDGSVKIWDLRTPSAVESLDAEYSITSVCFSQSSDVVFAAGNNCCIIALDLRMRRALYALSGHSDTVTGVRLSPDGTRLLSNSMDNIVRIWDVRHTSTVENRLQHSLQGAQHGLDAHLVRPAWSKDGSMIGTGSGDGSVIVWNIDTQQITCRRSAHTASANEIDFHPLEPIVVSCSSDKSMVLGEINSG
ncbi:U5 small nuclear ribonucleoprotein 40 kDa protein [Gamsiella multidivaricata]|uniref:U5 small nuclear ribonucleoprotein 40 kDa protein n=1 Tax=Gamsiella multidivaricata TaxID=101098 RepID=UPI0022206BF1|nr:U5 small nuclear ribonucleoprotein 40 kDa protein [Gamsiella multidivaricata]KAI7815981.1 U5 small nuclear ribonucleoprotein 40 kDa protein [Gamsiella multidivaricata]